MPARTPQTRGALGHLKSAAPAHSSARLSASHRIAFDAGRVCQVLTPGTLTDEELLGTPAAVYTLSVCEDEGSGTIGAARTAHSLRGVRRRASRAPRVAADERKPG